MTAARPEFHLEVGLSATPMTDPDDIVWTDLTARLLAVDIKRGRGPGDDTFPSGQITVELDNSDRLLDTANPDGLVPLVDGVGLPLCPLRLRARHDGGVWRPLFFGFLSEDPWTPLGESPWGSVASVRVDAGEALGVLMSMNVLLAEMEGRILDPMRASWAPDWWWVAPRPVDGRYLLLDGDVLPAATPWGSGLTVHLDSGETAEIMPPGQATPQGLKVNAGVECSAPEGDVMPAGDEAAVSAAITWTSAGHITGDENPVPDEPILAMTSPTGWSWDLACAHHDDKLGAIRARAWDPDGDLAAGTWVDPPDGWRFDATNSTARIVLRATATTLKVVVGRGPDGFTYESASGSTAGVVTAGDLIVGPAVVDEAVEEWSQVTWSSIMFWRRALTDEEMAEVAAFGAPRTPTPGWGEGDTLAEHLDRWLDVLGWPHGREFHNADPALAEAGDTAVTMWKPVVRSPSVSVGQQLRDTVTMWAGQVWTTRAGAIRARPHLSSIDPDHADAYLDATAALTDEPAPATALPVVRRSHPRPTGSLLQRVINRAEVRVDVPANVGATTVTVAVEDAASVAVLGRRPVEVRLAARSWSMAQRVADSIVARRAWPPTEAHDITVEPMRSTVEWGWVLDDLELETAVELTRTPPGGGDPVVETLQVQSEHWQITPDRAVVTIDLAES